MEENAYHESGHAFMAVYLGARVESVTVEPDWDDGPERYGDTQIAWPGHFSERDFAEKAVLVALAGPVAEMIHTGNPYHPGHVAEWAADWANAWNAAAVIHPAHQKRMAFLEQTSLQLYRLLNRTDCWAALAALADNLSAHETLEDEEVQTIVKTWLA